MERQASLHMSGQMREIEDHKTIEVKLSYDLVDEIVINAIKTGIEDLKKDLTSKNKIFDNNKSKDKKIIKDYIKAMEKTLSYFTI